MDLMTGNLESAVDDPLKTCVVCFNPAEGVSGGVGYLCPQCHHAVCSQCLERLPKAACPYCRLEAPRIAAAPVVEAPRPSPVGSFPACAQPIFSGGVKQPPYQII